MARIVCGGQTGVDRAALDFALARGIDYGGWCPRGGWAEDMPEPPGLLARYRALTPAASADPARRTLLNARDTDATLIVTMGPAHSPGTRLTMSACARLGRPVTVLDLLDGTPRGAAQADAVVLNVAGPRESEAPGIYARCLRALEEVLTAEPAGAR